MKGTKKEGDQAATLAQVASLRTHRPPQSRDACIAKQRLEWNRPDARCVANSSVGVVGMLMSGPLGTASQFGTRMQAKMRGYPLR